MYEVKIEKGRDVEFPAILTEKDIDSMREFPYFGFKAFQIDAIDLICYSQIYDINGHQFRVAHSMCYGVNFIVPLFMHEEEIDQIMKHEA